jgi:hypothetical protein
VSWKEISEEQYMEALEVLPPAVWLSKGFLLGEPETHRRCNVSGTFAPAFNAFVTHYGKFYAGASMTPLEFWALDVSKLCATSS